MCQPCAARSPYMYPKELGINKSASIGTGNGGGVIPLRLLQV